MSGRRANGEGSIRLRGDGRYEARVQVTGDDGRARRVSVFGRSRSEVVAKLREVQDRARDGVALRDARTTLGSWVEHWIDGPLRASGRAQSTQDQYAILLRTHVVPVLGERTLGQVRPSTVETLMHDLGERRSASTVRSVYAALRACMATAVRDGLIARNPVEAVRRPSSAQRQSARALTGAEVRKILTEARGHRLAPLVALVAGSGMRRSEALGLRWEDVDLDAGTASVSGALVRTSAGLTRGRTKSAKGERVVPLPAEAVDVLRAHRKAQVAERLRSATAWHDTDLVFTSEVGTPLEPRNVSRWYASLAERAGVSDHGMHALRHYAATTMLGVEGVTVRDVADVLGHSSPVVTLEVYAAAVGEQQRKATSALGAALGGDPS